MTLELVALVHAAATLAMTGLIWFVQVVHYPAFALVGAAGFGAYERYHVRRTSFVVAPLMLVELAFAIWLFALSPRTVLTLTGLGLLGVIWLSTALLQVPCHRALERGFDPVAARRLVRTNWIRTLAWTARALLVSGTVAPSI